MARNRDDTHLLYYYQDFYEFEELNETGLYCLSDSTVQIILSALRFSTWPTRWRVDRDDPNRAIAKEYWDTVKALGDLAYWEVMKDMSCELQAGFEALGASIEAASNKTAIDALALAVQRLAEAQCCDNLQIDVHGGIQGTITQESEEVIPLYGSVPPIGLGVDEFPDVYDDVGSYNTDKCRIANGLVDSLISTLTNLAAIGTFNALALAGLIGASIFGSILFPPAMIPTAISVLIILSGSLFVIAQVNASIIADREQWVCWLYEGEHTEEIYEDIAGALDIIISSIGVAGKAAWAVKTIVLLLLNSDTLNQLFAGGPVVGEATDCAGCGPCDPVFEYTFGSGSLDLDGTERTLSSGQYVVTGVHYLQFQAVETECCDFKFTILAVSDINANFDLPIYNCAGTLIIPQFASVLDQVGIEFTVRGNIEYPGMFSMTTGGGGPAFTVDVILEGI